MERGEGAGRGNGKIRPSKGPYPGAIRWGKPSKPCYQVNGNEKRTNWFLLRDCIWISIYPNPSHEGGGLASQLQKIGPVLPQLETSKIGHNPMKTLNWCSAISAGFPPINFAPAFRPSKNIDFGSDGDCKIEYPALSVAQP